METILTQDVIDERISIRAYQDVPVDPATLADIQRYIGNPDNLTGPFGHQIELDLVIENGDNEKQKIGTYGIISNAQGYILGGCTAETTHLFDYAYVFENLVLYLTAIGIGTCWLGGRFRKQHAMSQLSLAPDEIIPAITPIGYAREKPAIKERVMRTILKARKRKPENELFFYERFDKPLGDRAPEFEQALHYVRVAPSAQNKQPWRLIFNHDLSQVHFYFVSALSHNQLYMCEPEYLDIGIAYNHFERGLNERGIMGELLIAEPDIEKLEGSRYITSWYRDGI